MNQAKNVSPRPPTRNVFLEDGMPSVARVPHFNADQLLSSVSEALQMLGGIEKTICRGDKVMIKPNLSCPFSLPLTTDLAFLAATIELLLDVGAKITVGESSGIERSTDQVVRALKLIPMLERYGVPFINFERDEWLELEVPGEHWSSFRVPKSIYGAEKRVYLANMRCHASARFTASLKLAVGWLDIHSRNFLHADRATLEAKVAELHLGWQPDLVLIDGRRSTVTLDGRGEYIYPNVILASGDMVAIDTEAVKILKRFPGENLLDIPIQDMGQLKTAQKHHLGSMEYTLIEARGHTCTEEASAKTHSSAKKTE
jgi:uncharacterized protein (DUF362 family)